MINKNLKSAIQNRRTFYSINNTSPISDDEIKGIVDLAVTNVPSAFNSQSTRIVLLLGDHHIKLWQITKDILQKIVPNDAFQQTASKIDNSFASGYGTILFYEDQDTVEHLQNSFPAYKENSPVWSNQTSAMHQYAIWTMLRDAGLGASLQHYNPLIDDAIVNEWKINPKWKLIAQMPFGTPTQEVGSKTMIPLEERVVIYK